MKRISQELPSRRSGQKQTSRLSHPMIASIRSAVRSVSDKHSGSTRTCAWEAYACRRRLTLLGLQSSGRNQSEILDGKTRTSIEPSLEARQRDSGVRRGTRGKPPRKGDQRLVYQNGSCMHAMSRILCGGIDYAHTRALRGSGSFPIRESPMRALSRRQETVWLLPEPYKSAGCSNWNAKTPTMRPTWTPQMTALLGVFVLK